MKIAQQLYEGVALGGEGSVGLITYMRTDSPRLAGEAIGEFREWLGAQLGAEYVPESPRQFQAARSRAQDAHEAIRPTSCRAHAGRAAPFLTEEQFKLYDLIWKRAVASQVGVGRVPRDHASTSSPGASGSGHAAACSSSRASRSSTASTRTTTRRASRLPALTAGEALTVARQPLVEQAEAVRPLQHFTQPPPRYTEASLVKALEEENIGRPSTYATIVTTITSARQYVTRDSGRLVPTDLGRGGEQAAGAALPGRVRRDVHGDDGGGARRHRGGRSRNGTTSCATSGIR